MSLKVLRKALKHKYALNEEVLCDIRSLKKQIELRCRIAFEQIDTNHSGKISYFEFIKIVLGDLEPELTDEELQSKADYYNTVFDDVDTNSDKLISLDEAIQYQWKLIHN